MRIVPKPLFCVVLFFAVQGVLHAMSVRPPEFNELVDKAETVIRGEVVRMRCEWRGEGATRRIVTLVTIAVQRCVVGEAPDAVELEFLGGRVGDDELTVPGQPVFHVGGCDILFVQGNGRQMCPLVHAMFGRYQVLAPGRNEVATVARTDGTPLGSVDEVSLPLMTAAMVGPVRARKSNGALTAEAFEAQIVARARATGRQARQ